MLNHKTLSPPAAELHVILDELKSMAAPDRSEIEILRQKLDAEVEASRITLHEWRELVEKCSHVRRSVRA